MEPFWNFLEEPNLELLYKRNERDDVRFGELAETDRRKLGRNHNAVIIGFPYDEGAVRNRGRAGSASGPDEIRKAFYKLTPTKSFVLNDASAGLFDAGNIAKNLELEKAHTVLQESVSTFLRQGHSVIVLGGSNDMSYADFRACKSVFKNSGAINLDSHLDVRDLSNGINSGNPYKMLLDAGDLTGRNLAEYGIQEFVNSRGHLSYAENQGIRLYTLTRIRSRKNSETFMEAYRAVSTATDRVYVSFDMDAVRSSDSPGVSAPTPNGLTAEDILECAYLAGSEEKTAMIDICELNPKYDIDGRTAKLAALIAANFLAGMANRN